MAEKRFYKMTGKNANGRNVEAYYAGHGLDKIRLDAAEDAGAFPSDITHKTMKATEFYDELDRTEASKRVKSSKVRGIGRKWVVEEETEEDSQDVDPAYDYDQERRNAEEYHGNEDIITVNEKGEYVDENDAPLNPMLDENLLKAFEDAGYGYLEPYNPADVKETKLPDSYPELNSPSFQVGDDRVGLPDDDDEYEPDDEELMKHYRRMETQLNDPPVYGDPCNEPVEAIVGYTTAPDDKEDKYDTGKLEIPTEEQQKAELERLRKDPNTYPYPREEILDEDILSTSSNIPTRGTQQTYV